MEVPTNQDAVQHPEILEDGYGIECKWAGTGEESFENEREAESIDAFVKGRAGRRSNRILTFGCILVVVASVSIGMAFWARREKREERQHEQEVTASLQEPNIFDEATTRDAGKSKKGEKKSDKCGDGTSKSSKKSKKSCSPSMEPTYSQEPSMEPTFPPEPSTAPSNSQLPSISGNPSLSHNPSSEPSLMPSISTFPSIEPSNKPSLSVMPSVSQNPSGKPSPKPSISNAPSIEPTLSIEPSLSTIPSLSQTPSISKNPSSQPSVLPSISISPTCTCAAPLICNEFDACVCPNEDEYFYVSSVTLGACVTGTCGDGFTIIAYEQALGLDQASSSGLGNQEGSFTFLENLNAVLDGRPYEAVRFRWSNGEVTEAGEICFDLNPVADIFGTRDDAVAAANACAPISNRGDGYDIFTTSIFNFQSHVNGATGPLNENDMQFCKAAFSTSMSPNLPGDTGWGVTPADNEDFECGCNSNVWTGEGYYYGGTSSADSAALCKSWAGQWAAYKIDNEQKSGIYSRNLEIAVKFIDSLCPAGQVQDGVGCRCINPEEYLLPDGTCTTGKSSIIC